MVKISSGTYKILRQAKEPEMAEKDYLECVVLDKLFNDSYMADNMLFAGGASLSKSYQLSMRIGQDIDLVCTDFADIDIPDVHSNKQLEKFRKRFNAKVFTELTQRINQIINKNQQFFILTDFDCRGFANTELFMTSPTLHLMYKSEFCSNLGHLCIEIIPRRYPADSIQYTSVVPYSINQSLGDIPTVRYENTFWDKVYALHSNTVAKRPKSGSFFSRHYYDVSRLYDLNCVDLTKSKHMLFDIEKHQAKYTKKCIPALNSMSDIQLLPDAEALEKLGKDYVQMSNKFLCPQNDWNTIIKSLCCLNQRLKTL